MHVKLGYMEKIGKPSASHTPFVILFLFASLVGWLLFRALRPLAIEKVCADIAAGTSGFIYRNRENYDPQYEYDNVKQKCINESLGVQN